MRDDPAPARRGGPRTEEGKARSSRNALRHGLRAAHFTLLPEEDPAAFKALVAELRRVHAPVDPIELLQVDAIAIAIWREMRADRLEAEALADIPPAEPGRSCGSDLADAARRAGLATILRYRAQAQAEHRRALLLLEKHRRLRAAGPGARPSLPAAPALPASTSCTNEPGDPAAGEPAPDLGAEVPEPARVAPRARARAELDLKERIRAYARGLAELEATPDDAPADEPFLRGGHARAARARAEEDPIASAQALLDAWLERHPDPGPAAGSAPWSPPRAEAGPAPGRAA